MRKGSSNPETARDDALSAVAVISLRHDKMADARKTFVT
jgi:hypothetical protein